MRRAMQVLHLAAAAGVICAAAAVLGHYDRHDKAATTGVQTVTVAPSPACSDMARTWQQIALRYSQVATLAATGHHHQAGVEAQRTIRFVHSARVHHLIRNGACK